MHRLLMTLIAGVLVFGPSAALAETYPGPHEAGPNIYKQVFDNERVRVSEVTFNPGDSIPMHHHSYDHTIYVLEPGQLTISKPDGTNTVLDAKAGEVLWMGVEDHTAKNTGSTKVRVLITEIKK